MPTPPTPQPPSARPSTRRAAATTTLALVALLAAVAWSQQRVRTHVDTRQKTQVYTQRLGLKWNNPDRLRVKSTTYNTSQTVVTGRQYNPERYRFSNTPNMTRTVYRPSAVPPSPYKNITSGGNPYLK